MIRKPNIVLIVADQLNTRHLGCYPYPGAEHMHTPVLDALAARGATFDRAYCQSPICMPSRASFNTGLYPHTCRVLHNPVVLDPEFRTLAEYLSAAGYATGGFGHIGGDGVERGFQAKVDLVDTPLREAHMAEQRYLRERGIEHSAGLCGAHPFPEEALLDHLATTLACDWLGTVSQPFYLQLDLMNPHIPLLAPKRFVDLYNLDDIPVPDSWRDALADKPSNVRGTRRATRTESYTERETRESILHYRALVSYVDELAGRVLATLERIGASDDTIVCFFGDHGDYVGEFGAIGKTGNFYDCLTNVPLIVSGPREWVVPGRRADLVGLVDLAPTLLELAGVDGGDQMEGRSLAAVLRGESEDRSERVLGRYAFSETRGQICPAAKPASCVTDWPDSWLKPLPTDPYSSGPVSHPYDGVMVRDERYKLSVYGDGFMELYDLETDPWERANIAVPGGTMSPTHHSVLQQLLSALVRYQVECWRPERPQRPLPYHYRTLDAEFIPEPFRSAGKGKASS